MFDEYLRLFYSFPLYLLLILCIRQDITFVLPNPYIANVTGKHVDTNIFSSMSDNAWMRVKIIPGKYQLNANQLRNTRENIIKSVFIIIGGVLILFIIGGITGIIVYYVKKK